MATIVRRTPENEETSSYGYRDLLKDIMRKISTGATSNVERMTSGGMSDEEVLETALAPAGGMLKIAGTSKLLAGLLARQAQATKTGMLQRSRAVVEPEISKAYQGGRNVFREALKVPEKEYGRLKDIGWSSMKGEALGTKGLYFPMEKDIALHPTLADAETVWHEFTHSREWSPEYRSVIGNVLEATYAKRLRALTDELQDVSGKVGISPRKFYIQHSPIERHARGVSRVAKERPKEFDKFYKELLEKEVRDSETRLAAFWGKIDVGTQGMNLEELGRR